MMAVPSILIVIPNGKTNEAIWSETPNSSVVVFLFKGSVAAEDEVEKPNNATFAAFFINGLGLTLAIVIK